MTTWRQLKIERERICVRLSVSWREREREREWRQTSIAYCVRVSDVGKCVEERERERDRRPLDVTAPKPERERCRVGGNVSTWAATSKHSFCHMLATSKATAILGCFI